MKKLISTMVSMRLAQLAGLACLASACVERVTYTSVSPFTLALPASEVEVRQGGTEVLLRVSVSRGEAAAASRISLTVDGLPPGFFADPGEIAAGEELGGVRLRIAANAGQPGLSYPITVVGRSGGEVSEVTATAYLLGRAGTLDRMLPVLDRASYEQLQAAPTAGGGLLFTGVQLRRVDVDGHPDPSFGSAGALAYRDAVLGPGGFGGLYPYLLGPQRDGKTVLVMDYLDESHGGVLVFRVTADGEVDPAFGADRSSLSVRLPLPSYYPTAFTILDNDQLIILAEHETQSSPPHLLRLSADGELLDNRPFELPAGFEGGGAKLLMQHDGQLVITSAQGSVRFTTALEHDLTFGTGGTLVLGDQPTLLFRSFSGYVAAGTISGSAAVWGFDNDWEPLTRRALGTIEPPLTGDMSCATEVDGKVLAVIRDERVKVVRVDAKRQLDANFGTDGILDLAPASPHEEILGIVPTTRSRAFVVRRIGARYFIARIWR